MVGSRLEELPHSEAIAFVDRARRVVARPDLDGSSAVALLRRFHDAVTTNGLRLEKRR